MSSSQVTISKKTLQVFYLHLQQLADAGCAMNKKLTYNYKKYQLLRGHDPSSNPVRYFGLFYKHEDRDQVNMKLKDVILSKPSWVQQIDTTDETAFENWVADRIKESWDGFDPSTGKRQATAS